MSQLQESPIPLQFSGDDVEKMVLQAKKLVTIRAKAKGFKNGSLVQAEFTNSTGETTNQSLVVVSETTQRATDIHPGLLLLDGYLSAQAALDDLRTYYTFLPNDLKTELTVIFFLHQDVYQQLISSGVFSNYYLFEKFQPDEALPNSRFAHFFYPIFYWWLIEYHSFKPEEYPHLLKERGLAQDWQVENMQKYLEKINQDPEFFLNHFITGL